MTITALPENIPIISSILPHWCQNLHLFRAPAAVPSIFTLVPSTPLQKPPPILQFWLHFQFCSWTLGPPTPGSTPAPSFTAILPRASPNIPLPASSVLPVQAAHPSSAPTPYFSHRKLHSPTATFATLHKWPLTSIHCSFKYAKNLKFSTPYPGVIWMKTEICNLSPPLPTRPAISWF